MRKIAIVFLLLLGLLATLACVESAEIEQSDSGTVREVRNTVPAVEPSSTATQAPADGDGKGRDVAAKQLIPDPTATDESRAPVTLFPNGFTARTPSGWMYPDFDPGVKHYAVRCRPGGKVDFKSHLSLMSNAEREVVGKAPVFKVNGEHVPANNSMTVADWDMDYIVEISDGASGERVSEHTLHCLPLDFPEVDSWVSEDATVELISVALVVNRRIVGHSEFSPFSYLALVDRNGVPRFHDYVPSNRSTFKPVSRHPVRYAWSEYVGATDDPYNKSNRIRATYEIQIADQRMEVIDRRTTVDRRHTDNHDFGMTPDGNYLLLAYEPALRDMSPYGDYSTEEPSHDSLVQVVSPDGEVLLEWNSWDALSKHDCKEHWFPNDYSHINSVEWVDGNVLVSLRGCSRVLMFDGTTGETLWSVGPTTLDADEHESEGFVAPLRIEGDPQGHFCGQHSPKLLDGNRLIVYDNGVVCPTGKRENAYSRVVEYELDLSAGKIVWQREHRPLPDENAITYATGTVVPMENGNWLIGWGRFKYESFDSATDCPVHDKVIPSVVEYNPDTGEEVMRLHFRYRDCTQSLPSRAWPVSPDMFSP